MCVYVYVYVGLARRATRLAAERVVRALPAVGGWVSPCAVFPLWCAVSPLMVFSPAVCGGCAPLRSSEPRA